MKSAFRFFGVLVLLVQAVICSNPLKMQQNKKTQTTFKFDNLNSKSRVLGSAPLCNYTETIKAHVGTKECMYNDNALRKIGIGFNLDAPGAQAAVEACGADYNAILKGASTEKSQPCDCKKVYCLSQQIIKSLYAVSIYDAVNAASGAIKNFKTLCCDVRKGVVDLSFLLGSDTFLSTTGFHYWLNQYNWAAAADDLLTTQFCSDPQMTLQCNDDVAMIRKGCSCDTGPLKTTCSHGSACCSSSSTCCTHYVSFQEYKTKNATEAWCCQLQNANCCPASQNRCCPSGYPVCCTDGNYCCSQRYPNCRGGRCYANDGNEWILSQRSHDI